MPPRVSGPTICSLSPNTCFVLGERARVRGKTQLICENHALCRELFGEQRNARLATPQPMAPPLPTSPPEWPQGGRFGGERRRMGRNVDPGRREGEQRSQVPSLACLGYFLTPLQGSQDEAAASMPLHFLKNVQSPAAA